ncbi:YkgJ family cysteine cluster protein [Schinkia azotoformans]|uniref:YkgJ family cysteine cluster protein n=1 Tax=Schinkia azotoformans TaxID=1454 RepID=UPI002DB9F8DE|nr:YkgJ family cysteine cluster protein [Schinkia azotoformans]MEC1723082.1 YkgJ family cysteine cluster protein [Schinkia azotoformans]MED4414724.1 YkgJ family cysteine cluster protein [Schinkia azotoformans]
MKPEEKIINQLKLCKEFRNEPLPNDLNKPQKFINWYKKEIEWVSEQIFKVEEAIETYSTCKKGCNACCYLPIIISDIEAKAISYYVKNNIKNRRLIKEQVSRACEKIEKLDNTLIHNLNNRFWKYDNEQEIKYRNQYFNAKIPCPMLDEEGGCSIYPIRPSVCWAHKAYGDPEECKVSTEVSHAIHFSSYEGMITKRMFAIVKSRNNVSLSLLPLKLKENL